MNMREHRPKQTSLISSMRVCKVDAYFLRVNMRARLPGESTGKREAGFRVRYSK
jgi:hypothetical protein